MNQLKRFAGVKTGLILILILATQTSALAFDLLSPRMHAQIAWSDRLPIRVSNCRHPENLIVKLENLDRPSQSISASQSLSGLTSRLSWVRLPYRKQASAWIDLGEYLADKTVQTEVKPQPQALRLTVSGKCSVRHHQEQVDFTWVPEAAAIGERLGSLEISALGLANSFREANEVKKLKWDWEEAIAFYGFADWVSNDKNDKRLSEYLAQYFEKFSLAATPTLLPSIDRSDRVAPALAALAFLKSVPKEQSEGTELSATLNSQIAMATQYLKTEPRNKLGVLNHWGHSPFIKLYPDSIWLDSLMMVALLATKEGLRAHDFELARFGATQPTVFASKMLHPVDQLMSHAFNVEKEKRLPRSRGYWLRGNAWVLVACIEMLDRLASSGASKPGHPLNTEWYDLLDLFQRLANSISQYQMDFGGFDSIVNLPGYAYFESSGTALVGYALLKASNAGWFTATDSKRWREVSQKAWSATQSIVHVKNGEWQMPEISGPTIALPLPAYRMVPKKVNRGYGVGAYLLFAREIWRSQK